MDRIRIRGGRQLKGEIRISGSKNASLPLMVTALLSDKKLTLHNVPRLADITTMMQLLKQHGVEIGTAAGENGHAHGTTLTLQASKISSTTAPYDIVRKMRASVLVLGALLAREGVARVSLPGGCAIGARPVDLHIAGLKAMGAEIDIDGGYLVAKAPKGLKGARYHLPQGVGRRDREPDDGGGAAPRARPCSTMPRASPRSPISRTAWWRWACR